MRDGTKRHRVRFLFALSPRDKQVLDDLAEYYMQSRSALVRRLLLERARELGMVPSRELTTRHEERLAA